MKLKKLTVNQNNTSKTKMGAQYLSFVQHM
jgi:hypothetical protein